MKRYLRLRCPEWLVCTLTAAGLTANVLNGYDLKDPLSDSLPALTGVTAGIMAVIFLVCYSRKTLKFGVLISVGAATAAMAVLHLQKPYLTEQKSSLQIFWILTVLIGVGVYWISRTRAGAMVLFAVGNLVMAAVVFLKFGVDWPGYAFFMVGGAALVLFRVYLTSLKTVSVGSVQQLRYGMQIAGVLALSAAVGLGIYWGVIRPLHPPTHQLKLITKLKSMEQVHKVGVTSILSEVNYRRQSAQAPDEERTAKSRNDPGKTSTTDQSTQKGGIQKQREQNKTMKRNAANGDTASSTNQKKKEEGKSIRYESPNYLPLILPLAFLAAVIASIRIRKWLRRRWYRKILRQPVSERIRLMYSFFLRVLEKVHIRRRRGMTLNDFARSGRKYIEPYLYGDTDFRELTAIYETICYGRTEASEAEWEKFHEAYENLYRNVCEEVGRGRYLLLFYQI